MITTSSILDLLGPPLAWREQALCTQVGGTIFFPEPGGSVRDAQEVCSLCDVRAECLAYALENGLDHGVWGGVSEFQRRKMRPARVAVDA